MSVCQETLSRIQNALNVLSGSAWFQHHEAFSELDTIRAVGCNQKDRLQYQVLYPTDVVSFLPFYRED